MNVARTFSLRRRESSRRSYFAEASVSKEFSCVSGRQASRRVSMRQPEGRATLFLDAEGLQGILNNGITHEDLFYAGHLKQRLNSLINAHDRVFSVRFFARNVHAQ